MDDKKTIGIQATPPRNWTGVAYVFIPSDFGREEYIKNCFRTSTISMINENGERFHKIPVGKLALQFIRFPEDNTQLGSPVSWIKHPTKNRPIVVDVYDFSDEYSDISGESQFNFKRDYFDGSSVQFSGDAKNGIGRIVVNSKSTKGGKLYIDISNPNESGELLLTVKGNIKVFNSGTSSWEILKTLAIKTHDNVNLESLKTFNIFAKEKIILGDPEKVEKSPLGETLAKLLEDLIEEISKSTTATAIGTQPLINASKILAFKEKVKEILSELNYTQ